MQQRVDRVQVRLMGLCHQYPQL